MTPQKVYIDRTDTHVVIFFNPKENKIESPEIAILRNKIQEKSGGKYIVEYGDIKEGRVEIFINPTIEDSALNESAIIKQVLNTINTINAK